MSYSRILRLVLCALLVAGWSLPAHAEDVTVVAVGDVACSPDSNPHYHEGAGSEGHCRQNATADLALHLEPQAVLALGDLQYSTGRLAAFEKAYGPSWGRLKAVTHPVPGNHEYLSRDAVGYYRYFGAAAGERGEGYYSFDLGAWHLVALNSNCAAVGGCGAGSAQLRWLRADLEAHPAACTLAYWHHPRFSSGRHGSDDAYAAFWQVLYDADAEAVLVGHDHDYERFAPQDADGRADPDGPREFVVGTGGVSFYGADTSIANSEMLLTDTFGVLRLELRDDGYAWAFLDTSGRVRDRGEAGCR